MASFLEQVGINLIAEYVSPKGDWRAQLTTALGVTGVETARLIFQPNGDQSIRTSLTGRPVELDGVFEVIGPDDVVNFPDYARPASGRWEAAQLKVGPQWQSWKRLRHGGDFRGLLWADPDGGINDGDLVLAVLDVLPNGDVKIGMCEAKDPANDEDFDDNSADDSGDDDDRTDRPDWRLDPVLDDESYIFFPDLNFGTRLVKGVGVIPHYYASRGHLGPVRLLEADGDLWEECVKGDL